MQEKVDAYGRLDHADIERIKDELISLTNKQLGEFRLKLCNSLERKIDVIRIISVFGEESTFLSVHEACDFITKFEENLSEPKFYGFEIYIRYSNGDKLEAKYADRSNAIAFLQNLG